jgi:putative endonuclease
MYYVYILKSSKFQRRIYIGSTNNLKRRFEEHNKGLNKSTKYGIPWKLIYYEAFLSKKDCLKRENNL